MFSPQELVSCVPNPQHCGGAGGCDGSTVEVAMQWIMQNGLKQETEVDYQGRDAACARTKHVLSEDTEDFSASSFGLKGFEQLPSNQELPLVQALVEKGPVAISVAATGWFSYAGGIFNGCAKDSIVDHAVTLYGYGQEGPHKYWQIRNSWGQAWGENGFVRMLRHKDEESYCGIDSDPKKGTGCDGGPAQVTVCGNCGMLYDSVVPKFGKTKPQAADQAVKVSDSRRKMHKELGSDETNHHKHSLTKAHGHHHHEQLKSEKRRKKRPKSRKHAEAAEPESLLETAEVTIGSDAVPRLVRRE
jgi:hypothetical protein